MSVADQKLVSPTRVFSETNVSGVTPRSLIPPVWHEPTSLTGTHFRSTGNEKREVVGVRPGSNHTLDGAHPGTELRRQLSE